MANIPSTCQSTKSWKECWQENGPLRNFHDLSVVRVATRLSLVVYQHPACITMASVAFPATSKVPIGNWVIFSFNVVHSLNISVDYSNRSHDPAKQRHRTVGLQEIQKSGRLSIRSGEVVPFFYICFVYDCWYLLRPS